MAILKILQYPDPLLSQKARPVGQIDGEILKLIDDLFDTLYAAPGLGLAAPQVGISLRLFVYDMAGSGTNSRSGITPPRDPKVLVNPEIISMGDTQSEEEGCLSVAGYRQVLKRARQVEIRGLGRDGQPIQLRGEGLQARLFQHEVDHLDGVLYIDRLSSLKRNIFLRKFKKRSRLGV